MQRKHFDPQKSWPTKTDVQTFSNNESPQVTIENENPSSPHSGGDASTPNTEKHPSLSPLQ